MDDMAPYYPPPPPPPGSVHYPYYQQPPPSQPPPVVVPPPQHHLVQPYFPQQPPPFASYAAPLIPQPSYDELRTLFVAGLPEDVKPREIYNLFREFPGYESSHLRTPNGKSQPFAFAVFLDQQSAIGAMHALNGMVFDLEKGSTLYIDLAKSNSRSKRSRTDDERTGSDKRARSSSYSRGTPDSGKRIVCNLRDLAHANSFVCSCLYINHPDVHYAISILYMINFLDDICLMIAWSLRPETITWSHGGHIYLIAHIAHVLHAWTLAGVGSIHIPGMGNSAYNMTGYPSAPSHGNFNGRAVHETISPKANNSSVQHFPHNNTPCPTLFVANLGPTCTEQELIQVFSRCPGFIKLKMQSTYGAPVAFVDFQDTACSTGALSHLQGTFLYSSTAGEGMRLEYARSRMGMRKKPK